MDAQGQMPLVDADVLTPHARTQTACPNLQLDDWHTTCLSVQGRRSIFRFAGIGRENAAPRAWSLILKVLRASMEPDNSDNDVRDFAYWQRESLLYTEGLPQTLAGAIRSPLCYGVAQPAPDTRWIWLEDLTDCYDGNWPLDRFALAARHLGIFNGTYVGHAPLPGDAWLSRDGLRSRSAEAAASISRMADPALWAHPLLRRAFRVPVLDRIERLVADRKLFLRKLASLPQTMCHLDAWHGNMFAVQDAAGNDTTVLFDWALAGYGALGEEIGHLVWVSLLEFKIDVQDAARLEADAFESYLAGLAEVGWRGDAHEVRLAYLINSVLNFGLMPEAIDHALNDQEYTTVEQFYGRSIEAIVEQSAAVTMLLLDRADELRSLLQATR